MSTSILKKLVISAGDPYGIGPEVTIKAIDRFQNHPFSENVALIWVGPKESIINDLDLKKNLDICFISHMQEVTTAGFFVLDITALVEGGFQQKLKGSCNQNGGQFAYVALEKAVSICLAKDAAGLITAPISKEAMQLAKSPLLGHTEYLSARANNAEVVMILAQANLRVALLTVHIPLKEVAQGVTIKNLSKTVSVLLKELTHRFAISNPKIAVLGLNPHAGENGYLGTEELEVIKPFIESFNAKYSRNILVGPFAADGFFGSKEYEKYDAVLAMYHDQGLVGFKSLAFGGGVNVTAGLPFVRTSPDHGTAYAIAGKHKADESSMLEALVLACTLSENL